MGAKLMKKNHPYQRYYFKVKPALNIKLEEFTMLGLNEVVVEDIWNYLTIKSGRSPKRIFIFMKL